MPFRRTGALAALVPFVLLAATAVPARSQNGQTAGIFVDRANKPHNWSVNAGHTLLWENQPYVPVGGLFSPRYLALGATEENWQKDVAGLEVLKAKGVQDVIIDPVISPVDIPAAAWQRVVDYLDGNGFRYGISFGAGVNTPLSGTVVKPTNYRIEDVRENVDLSWSVADSDTARYVLVDGTDGTNILSEGTLRVRNNSATLPGNARIPQGTVAILYPHKALKVGRNGSLPDVWAGYDRYRDKLVALFTQVKFGSGLRFFLDPLVHPISLQGEVESLIPDSPAFRLEWEAYLASRYPTVEDIMNAWGISEREGIDVRQASRMIPLASNGRGVPFFLDTTTGKRYETRGGDARFWSDLSDCRTGSLTYYLNAITGVLKREVADVPIVFTRTHHHRIFANQDRNNGFDGLGIAAYARGSAIVSGGAGSVIMQAQEAKRPVWCVVTETQDTSSTTKSQLGYPSQQTLFYDLDWLRGIGAKGFFVNGFQVLPEEPYQNFQLLKAPEQIGWLKAYADRMKTVLSPGDGRGSSILPFPTAAAGVVRPGPIPGSSVYWAESLAPGKLLNFGTSYQGYIISLPEGETTVLWSLSGPRQTRLRVGDTKRVEISTPDGVPVKFKADAKKHMVTLEMGDTPLIIKGNESENTYPMEAVEDVILLLKALVAQATDLKLPEAQEFKFKLDRAETNYKLKSERIAFLQAAEAVNGILQVLQPYTWLEAERAGIHTFSEAPGAPAASGEAFLALNTDARPGNSGYGAEYKFNAPSNDTYTLWIACTPPGPNTSPFVWLIDNGQARSSAEATTAGSPYMSNQFVWMNLGRVQLDKGPHTLTLRVVEQAQAGRYALALDALMFTRGIFSPNGIARPTIMTLAEMQAIVKAAAKKK
jgi:hypothetical protein